MNADSQKMNKPEIFNGNLAGKDKLNISYKKIIFRNIQLQPFSRLYCLPPTSIGTPYVESLTGYIARLAENHNVSTGQLFAKELVPNLNRPYLVAENQRQDSQILFRLRGSIQAVNGTNRTAIDYAAALQNLTLQNHLKYLTLFPWKDVISFRFLLRRKRAWCPQCFYEDKETLGTVYEHLLWVIKFATVCIKHQIPLISICPFCNKESSILTPKARPGHCYRCGKWLGTKSENKMYDLSNQTDNYQTELQVSRIISELLVLPNKSENFIENEIFSHNLLYCLQKAANNNLNAFARFLEVLSTLISGVAKKGRHIQLDSLVKIIKNLNIPVEILFLQKLSNRHVLPQIHTTQKLTKDDKLEILNKALTDSKRPSLSELATKYGYSTVKPFRGADMKLCRQITARNISANPRKLSPPKKHNSEIIKKTLIRALKENPPPTLKFVADKLGYKIVASLRNRCPELSKQLVERRSEYFKELEKKLEASLKTALNDFPPVSLGTIAKKLGYTESSTIRERFPELCRAISIRFKEYKPKIEFVSKALLTALTQTPPPSIESISKSLKVSISFLYKYNSDICYQISERHRQFKKDTSLQRRKERQEMIRNIVLDLHAKGIYPSQDKVSQLLSASFNRVHDLAFLIELRKSLDID